MSFFCFVLLFVCLLLLLFLFFFVVVCCLCFVLLLFAFFRKKGGGGAVFSLSFLATRFQTEVIPGVKKSLHIHPWVNALYM